MAKKDQKFKACTADEKYNVIKSIIDLEISLAQVGKNTGVNNSKTIGLNYFIKLKLIQ